MKEINISKALENRKPFKSWLEKRMQWRHDCISIAEELEKTVKNFNALKFFKDCGIENTEICQQYGFTQWTNKEFENDQLK